MNLFKVSILTLLSLTLLCCASPQRSMEREVQKAERELLKAEAFTDAVTALAAQKFIVKVDLVVFRLGQTVSTSPSTNFVSLYGKDASIQVSFDFVMRGPNFLGGVTVDGEAHNITMKTDKHGTVNYHMDVSGANVSSSVDIKLFAGDNKCEVYVSPNANRERVILRGYLFPESQTSIFKGISL